METYIHKAMAELRVMSLRAIQVETARTWAGRACAAAQLGLHHDAVEYSHEALEHAALSGSDNVLHEVRAAMRSCGVEL